MIELAFFLEIISSPDFSDTIIFFFTQVVASFSFVTGFSLYALNVEVFQILTLGSLICLHSLNNFIQSHSFICYLCMLMTPKCLIFSPDLFSKLYIYISYLLFNHFLYMSSRHCKFNMAKAEHSIPYLLIYSHKPDPLIVFPISVHGTTVQKSLNQKPRSRSLFTFLSSLTFKPSKILMDYI